MGVDLNSSGYSVVSVGILWYIVFYFSKILTYQGATIKTSKINEFEGYESLTEHILEQSVSQFNRFLQKKLN